MIAAGTSGAASIAAHPGLLVAVRMVVATEIITAASAPKIRIARIGAAGRKARPKIAATNSGAAAADMPAKGSNSNTTRIALRARARFVNLSGA